MRLQGEMIREVRRTAPEPALPTSQSVRLGVLLALVGGALDAYTFVGHGGVFANAQTGNVVLLGVAVARGQWTQALRHLPAILAFVLGVVVAETLKRPGVAAFVRWPARAALALEIVVLAAVALMPVDTPDLVVTVVIAFVASVQVSTFRKLVDTAYNTTMTTGNLRTAIQSACTAVVDRDREAARRARQLALVITAFLAGALGGGLLTATGGVLALWALVGLLTLGLALFVHDERVAVRSPAHAGGTPPGNT